MIARTQICVLILMCLVALAGLSSAVAQDDSGWSDDNFFTPFIRGEPASIAASEGLVEKTKDELRIKTPAGPVAFDNRGACDRVELLYLPEGGCHVFIYLSHDREHHGFLVLVGYYEAYGYRWVDDATGKVTELDNVPHFSPSGRAFVVVDSADAYSTDSLQVWSSEGPTRTWMADAPYDAHFVRWEGEERVVLRVSTMVDNKLAEAPAALVRTTDGWRIDAPPERSQ